MRYRTITAMVCAVPLLAGCSHPKADAAACERALRANLAYALTHPDATPMPRPPACVGVPDATVERIAEKIMSGG